MTKAALWLLDEPASGLDPASYERFVGLVREPLAAGITICLIEHNLDIVHGISDRIAFLDQGTVLAAGEPRAILNDPKLGRHLFRRAAMTLDRDLIWNVENASAGYGPKQVLFDLSVQQRTGELVCLLGHNGAGKSTLLKVLYGLLRRAAVACFIAVRTSRQPGWQLGSRPASPTCREGAACFSNSPSPRTCGSASRRRSCRAAARDERLDEVFSAVPDPEGILCAQRAGLLSGGQQQMLSLGRTILSRPTCLLARRAVDRTCAETVPGPAATIQRMQRQMNMAMLLVEQNVREALAIADRAYVMKAGRMVYCGPPAEIDDHAKLMDLY